MASISAILPGILLIFTSQVLCERWARQIPNNGFSGTSLNDWVPVPCPTCKPADRQQGARVLNFGQVAQASTQQQQFIQNVIPHQKHWQNPKLAFNEEPMALVSQGFLVPPPQPNQQQFGFVNQYPQFAYQHENEQQYLHRVPIPQVNNLQYEYVQQPQIDEQVQPNIPQPLAEALIMQKPQVYDKNEVQNINHFPQQQQQQQQQQQSSHQPEEVQLLYVPLDTLYQQKQQQDNHGNRNNLIPTNVNPHQINNFYNSVPSSTPANQIKSFYNSVPPSTPGSNSIPNYQPTERPSSYERTKVKPNQPPLAMFMKNKVTDSEISIGDVLKALKNAKNIDVLDSASKKSPKVFVGPSGLKTPEGYTKFELPYLSSIEQDRPNRQVTNLPFFVAPLSYRAPNGFAKIPLPAPHVGSVVVNTPDNRIESINSELGFTYDQQPSFYQPLDFQTQQFYEHNFDFFNPTAAPSTTSTTTTTTTTTTPRPVTPVPTSRSTTQRSTTTSRPIQRHTTQKPNLGFRFGSNVFSSTVQPYQTSYDESENQEESFRNDYNQSPVSSTTERNFEYYNRNQDSTYSRVPVSSTTEGNFNFFNKNNNFGTNVVPISSSTDRTYDYNNRGQTIVSSRPQEQDFAKYSNLEAYKTFKPIPTSHVTNEEYFNIDNMEYMKTLPFNQNVEQYKDTTSEASFIPSNPPKEYTQFRGKYTFEEKQNDFHEKKIEDDYQTQTAKPVEYSTKAQEIIQMKSHFREQNSQHTRPKLATTTDSPTQQTFSYTPVTISFENLLKPLSSTANYDFFDNIKSSEDSTVDAKPVKVSYFTPTPNYDDIRADKPRGEEPVKYFKYSIIDSKVKTQENSPSTTGTEQPIVEHHSVQPLPGSVAVNENKYWDHTAEYNQYNGPSTLRSVQSLPGLINGLMDETSDKSLVSTTETVNIPRRTQTRRRRPDTTQAPITTTTENSGRRTSHRGRRPIHYANRTTTVRTTIARNTNRVRYNPTPEERQQLRTQPKKESENLEYQRDVLKQNYPVISRNPSTEAPLIGKLSSSFSVGVENEKVNESEYVVANEREDLLSKEDDSTTAIPVTTLRPVPYETNQRPNFRQSVRKTHRFYSTTPTSPSTSEPTSTSYERPSRDRYTVRPRSRYEITTQLPRTTKKRNDLRQRRPTTTRTPATTTVPEKDEAQNNDSYHQISRFNTDFYQESTPPSNNYRTANERPKFKNHRYSGSNFGLKSEETRWSVKSNQSSFHPIDPESNYGSHEDDSFEENEPMIVTAQSLSNQDLESFNIPVKQSFDFSQGSHNKEDQIQTTEHPPKETPMETLFEDLINEIVSDNQKNEIISEADVDTKLPTNHKNDIATEPSVEKKGHRRGVWKRIRVRPLDGFETAESQNYGQQYFNQISNVDEKQEKSEKVKKLQESEQTPTTEAVTSRIEAETTTVAVEVEPETNLPIVSENESISSSTTTEVEKVSTTESPVEVTTTMIPDVEQSFVLTTIHQAESKSEDTTRQAYSHSVTTPSVTEHYTETPYYDDYDTERIFTDEQDSNQEEDQVPQSSNILSEVKQKLTDLFSFDSDYDYQESNLPLKMQQYTTIERVKSVNRIPEEEIKDKKPVKAIEVATEATSSFHKNLMDSVIYATSTSTEVSHETEICYRGRCIKTDKKLKT